MTSHCDVFMCHLLNRCFWLRRFHGQRSGKMDRMEQMFNALMTRFDKSDTNLQIEVNHINCRIDDMFTAVMTKLDGLDNAPTAVDSGAPRRQSSITESDPFELLQGDAEPIIPPFPMDHVAMDSDDDDAPDDVLDNDGVPDGSNLFEVDDCEIVGPAQPATTTPQKRQLLECLSIDSGDPPDKFARVSSQNIDTPPDTNITPEKLPQSIPNPMPLELADRQLPPKLLPAGVAKVLKRPSGSGGIVRHADAQALLDKRAELTHFEELPMDARPAVMRHGCKSYRISNEDGSATIEVHHILRKFWLCKSKGVGVTINRNIAWGDDAHKAWKKATKKVGW